MSIAQGYGLKVNSFQDILGEDVA